jgi:tRNA threonylcarbamoyladenosine biosynthesis protein TsaB
MTVQLLAIDASTDRVELALAWRGQNFFATLPGGAESSVRLLPAVQALCVQAGAALAELDAIAFGAGPGAFTGLRTACALAQGLAFGLGLPVLALDTLAVVAESAWGVCGATRLWASLDARMGEVYAVPLQRFGPGVWRTERPVSLYSPEALLAALLVDEWLVGPAVTAYAALSSSDAGTRCAQAHPAGAALLQVATAAWMAGAARPADQALPLYVRDKVAETTSERAARRTAQTAAALALP